MNLTRAIVFGAALVLGGCATMIAPQVRLPAPYTVRGVSVTVEGLWRDADGNVVGISGIATNTSDQNMTMCMLTFDVLDASGVKVSSALASTTGLKVDQKWRFQATFLNPFSVNFTSIEAGTVTAM